VLAHHCPVCGARHEVKRADAEMALGAQLCCGPECAAEQRRRLSRRHVKASQIKTEVAAYAAVALLIAIALAVKWG
jgi:hypothetical protein